MTNYARGAQFEYRCKRHLESLGARVIRVAGSHTEFDLIADWPQPLLRSWWVQCRTNGRMSKLEKTSLAELAEQYGKTAVLMSKDSKGHTRVEELQT